MNKTEQKTGKQVDTVGIKDEYLIPDVVILYCKGWTQVKIQEEFNMNHIFLMSLLKRWLPSGVLNDFQHFSSSYMERLAEMMEKRPKEYISYIGIRKFEERAVNSRSNHKRKI